MAPSNGDDARPQAPAKAQLRSLFAFTRRDQIPVLSGAILCAIGCGVIKPALAILVGYIFDDLANYGTGNITASELLSNVSTWALALLILAVITCVCNGGLFMLWALFGELQAKAARNIVFRVLIKKDIAWFDLREDGISSLPTRIQTQVRELQLGTSQPMGLVLMDLVTFFAATGIAFYESWKLTLAILAIIPVATVVVSVVTSRVRPAIELQKKYLTSASNCAYSAISNIDTVKAYNAQDQEAWMYGRAIRMAAAQYQRQAKASSLQLGVAKFAVMAMFVQGFWYGNYLVGHGLSAGTVLTTFYSCLQATQSVEQALPQWLVITKGMSAGASLHHLAKTRGRSRIRVLGLVKSFSFFGQIDICNVTFSYPSNHNQKVLKNLSATFRGGETTFVIGRSGSGKSTIGNLLVRFYKPSEGEILIDGQSIHAIDQDALLGSVTLVQQESSVLNDSILSNISLGRNGQVSDADIKEACQTTQLTEMLERLPDGIHTVVGRDGRGLSGGQRQRVALARARLRDTPILILDESTSALDPTTRVQVMAAIREWRRGKTTIVITHELSQINNGDYVYVLENSVLVEEGYHESLMQDPGGRLRSFSDERQQASSPEPTSPTESEVSLVEPSIAVRAISKVLDVHSAHTRVSTHFGFPAEWEPRQGPVEDIIRRPTNAQKMATRVKEIPLSSFNSLQRNPATLVTQNRHKESCTVLSDGSSSPLSPTTNVSNTDLGLSTKSLIATDVKEEVSKTASLREALGAVWPHLQTSDRLKFVTASVCACCAGGVTPVFSYLFSQLLNTLYATSGRMQAAEILSAAILGLALFDSIISFTMHFLFEQCGQAWVDNLRNESFRHILVQHRSWFDRKKNAINRLTECLDGNAEELKKLVGRFVGYLVMIFVMISVSLIWAVAACWNLALVCLSCMPVVYGLTRLFEATTAKFDARINAAALRATSIMQESFSNIRLVRAFMLADRQQATYEKETTETYKIGKQRALWSGVFFGISQASSILVTALIFYYGALIVSQHGWALESILEASTLLLFGIGNANAIIAFIPQISSSLVTARYMLQLASLPQDVQESFGRTVLPTPLPVQFNRVDFAYPNRPHHFVLQDFCLRLEAGSCTAVVGSSGCGKSTVAHLLLGFYSPQTPIHRHHTPPLTFAGTPIYQCHMASLRSQIAIVAQHPMIVPGTVTDNITYGLRRDSVLRQRRSIEQSAIEAGIHDFIVSLPDGYETLLGDGGQALSGGQAQRLAIARALLRRPRILVLDEATSALDVESAEMVRQTISSLLERGRRAGKGRGFYDGAMAVVLISHKVETMRIADRVVYLKNGRVAETGSYKELMRAKGPFAQFVSFEMS